MSVVETEHPTAEEELDRVEHEYERVQEERERLERGEVSLPWPHDSKAVGAMGIINVAVAGGLWASPGDSILTLGGLVVGVSGVMLLLLARWLHTHFEIDPQPSYEMTAAATDGGEE